MFIQFDHIINPIYPLFNNSIDCTGCKYNYSSFLQKNINKYGEKTNIQSLLKGLSFDFLRFFKFPYEKFILLPIKIMNNFCLNVGSKVRRIHISEQNL